MIFTQELMDLNIDNGIIYPLHVVTKSFHEIHDRINNNLFFGVLHDHGNIPTGSINIKKISHMISDIKFLKDKITGKITILKTPCGLIVKNLIQSGKKYKMILQAFYSFDVIDNKKVVKQMNIISFDFSFVDFNIKFDDPEGFFT